MPPLAAAGRGGKSRTDDLPPGIGVESRMEQLVERRRVDARDRLGAADDPFVGEIDGDLERGPGGALPRPRLQHPELALLDGELDVLHVAKVLLEAVEQDGQLRKCRRQQRFQRGRRAARRQAGLLGDALRGADAGDDVFSLCVDEKFAVKLLVAGRRIAGEGDAGRRSVAAVAEHHRLDIDRRSPALRNVVQTPVGSGAGRLPRQEHRSDGPPQLLLDVFGETAWRHALRRAPCSARSATTNLLP